MPDDDARAFLRRECVARVGTADSSGWPYVVALMYVYEAGELLYLHTGSRPGHFLANIRQNPRICIHVSDSGALHRGAPSVCDSALAYKSAVAFGTVRILDGPSANEEKSWFFDQLLVRMNEPRSAYAAGYPMLDHIILYEVALEIVTGKLNVGIHH